jgi:RNA polymerase sigma factor (sigma-70 family)
MAKKLNLSVQQIEKLMRASKISQGTSSLETPIDADGSIFIRDIIPDKKSATPESISELLRQHSDLDQTLDHLDPREKEIIQRRFGLGGNPPESLEQVGAKLKLSRERVRQLEERAIKRLKSIALRIKLIDSEDAKKMLLDSRQEKQDRRTMERRVAKCDRRQGYQDTRKVKIQRRKTKRDRRVSKTDRRLKSRRKD